MEAGPKESQRKRLWVQYASLDYVLHAQYVGFDRGQHRKFRYFRRGHSPRRRIAFLFWSEATPTDTPTFSLGIDLGKIAQSKVDMKINADIVGDYVDIDSKRMKTLSTASGKLAIKVLITLNVNFSLTLENVQNHVYRLCWDDSSSYRNGSSDVSGSVSSIYESMLGKEGESEFLYSDNFNSIAAWSVRP